MNPAEMIKSPIKLKLSLSSFSQLVSHLYLSVLNEFISSSARDDFYIISEISVSKALLE